MKRLLWIIPVAFLAGCGGSSSSTSGLTSAQTLLEDCVSPDVLALTALLDQLETLAAGDSTALGQALKTTSINLLQGTVGFTLDADIDGTDDLGGVLRFEDAAGNPTIPVDVATILSGNIPDLATILAGIPDGTTLVLDFNLLTGTPGTGTLRYTFAGGVVTGVEGTGTYSQGACVLDYDFAGDIPDSFDSLLPIANISFDLDAGTDRVLGSLDLDGSDLAKVRAHVGNRAEENFLLNLLTGEVLPG